MPRAGYLGVSTAMTVGTATQASGGSLTSSRFQNHSNQTMTPGPSLYIVWNTPADDDWNDLGLTFSGGNAYINFVADGRYLLIANGDYVYAPAAAHQFDCGFNINSSDPNFDAGTGPGLTLLAFVSPGTNTLEWTVQQVFRFYAGDVVAVIVAQNSAINQTMTNVALSIVKLS